MAGSLNDPLWAARLQDVSAWLALAVLALLAPVEAATDVLGLPALRPAAAWQAAGVALAAGAVALWRSRSRAAVTAAAAVDVAGAAALAVWLASGPGLGTRGTIVVAVVLASLVVQAAVDAVMLVSVRPGSR